ncbi:MAG: PPOX class F420-dependent oxidoreductase [Dehalococcoidia bacterium]|nr:PPOX class F420-dependent oxidoreductase [Chloroflexota bacterium]MXW25433.1 PPOX class F420-dependent oxidoreductase [Dehalococcoidia bacterium]MXY88210.1 PPOX class F420-dependent oxidoreductase [Dehalococcoidia bacterium]MYA54464.1 PPOX class F420-dependent oxidoreductase [Dehalococcoidia bacterium]MYH68364.1 PPOX class F420-dependent oxidoreductase [Dehalococcoidia bacterium]
MPMSREEMDAFLAEPRNAIVATVNPDGFPQLTPIWFHWEDGTVYFSTTAPRLKTKNLERDGRVSICVDEPGDPDQRTVVLGAESCTITPGLGTVTETIARKYGGENWETSYEHIANTPDRVVVSYKPTRILTWSSSADRREHVQKHR